MYDKDWKQKEIDRVEELYPYTTVDELSLLINRTASAIQTKIKKSGIYKRGKYVTYLVYYPSLGVFKVGASSNLRKRMNDLDEEYEVIFTRLFVNRYEAFNLERVWKSNIAKYIITEPVLKNGNTEVFKYDLD